MPRFSSFRISFEQRLQIAYHLQMQLKLQIAGILRRLPAQRRNLCFHFSARLWAQTLCFQHDLPPLVSTHGFAQNFHIKFSRTRSVELAEINALPCAE